MSQPIQQEIPGASAAAQRITALLDLLGDPSPTVWSEVRRELERLWPTSRPSLKRAATHGEARARSRARQILVSFARRKLARRLVRFACRPKLDLERGLWLLSRYEEPELDVRPYVLALDAMAAEVLRRVEAKPPGLERALILAQYLGRELGYRGDESDYHHPDNVYLHRSIVRKRGLPLTLCAIYLFVARRANLQASILPLPGHVMLRITSGSQSAIIDPFHSGAVRNERELLKYLAQSGLAFHPSWFREADEATLLQRQTMNLRSSWLRRARTREIADLDLVLGALSHARSKGQKSLPA